MDNGEGAGAEVPEGGDAAQEAPQEDPREKDPNWAKFRQLANERVLAVEDRLRILGKLARKGAYPYREEDLAKLETRLQGGVTELIEKFRETLAEPEKEAAPEKGAVF